MKTRRRDIEIFSLSFLDVICCGFGAIILLFVLSKFAEPVIIEELSEDLQSVIVRLEEELHEIRGETAVLNREKKNSCRKRRKNWPDCGATCQILKENLRHRINMPRCKISLRKSWREPCSSLLMK